MIPVLSYSVPYVCPEVPSMQCEFVTKSQPYGEKVEEVCENVPQEVCAETSLENCTMGYTEQCSFIPVKTCEPGELKPVCRMEMTDKCQIVTKIEEKSETREECNLIPECIDNLDCKMDKVCHNSTEEVCDEEKTTICQIKLKKVCSKKVMDEPDPSETCYKEKVCTDVFRTVCEPAPGLRIKRSANINCRTELICRTKLMKSCKTTPDIVRTCAQAPRTVCTSPRGRWGGGSSCRSVPAQDCVERKVYCLTRPVKWCKNEMVCEAATSTSPTTTQSTSSTSSTTSTSSSSTTLTTVSTTTRKTTQSTTEPSTLPNPVNTEVQCRDIQENSCKLKQVCKPIQPKPTLNPIETCHMVPIKTCRTDISMMVCKEKTVEKCKNIASPPCKKCTLRKVCKKVEIKVPHQVEDLSCSPVEVQVCSAPQPSCSETQEKVCQLVPNQCKTNVEENCQVLNTRVCKPVKTILSRPVEDKVCKLVMIKAC